MHARNQHLPIFATHSSAKTGACKLIFVFSLAALFSVPSPSFARVVRFKKKVDLGVLHQQLTAQGFLVDYIECSQDDCRVVMPDKEMKNPLPIVEKYVYVNAAEIRLKKREAMRALYLKWVDGTITPAEKDELLRMLVQHVLGI